MKSKKRFSEQVLEQTLCAVRHKKRRGNQRRAGLVLLAALTVVLRPRPSLRDVVLADGTSPIAEPKHMVVFSSASSEGNKNAFTVFSSREVAGEIKQIDAKEMSEMLAGIPHGFYKTADGESRFWSSALAPAGLYSAPN